MLTTGKLKLDDEWWEKKGAPRGSPEVCDFMLKEFFRLLAGTKAVELTASRKMSRDSYQCRAKPNIYGDLMNLAIEIEGEIVDLSGSMERFIFNSMKLGKNDSVTFYVCCYYWK